MKQKAITYLLSNVEALYPRLDQPYRFDPNGGKSGNGGTVPCKATDNGAAYTTSFKLPKDKAADLAKAMKSAYDQRGFEEKMQSPFKLAEDGETYIGKAKLAAAFGTQLTRPPIQVDATKQLLPSDFQLTSGSTINIFFELIPYNGTMGSGVSLRLRQLQVVSLAEAPQAIVFDELESSGSEPIAFADVSGVSVEVENKPEEEPEELIEEPKVKPNKKKKVEPDGDVDLASLLDEYDD